MGYTKGRILTKDLIENIAKKYNTRSDFQKSDPSAYKSSKMKYGKDFRDQICRHMIVGNFSIPQLIFRKIIDTLTPEITLYDTRTIITPYELDIYIPKYKVAFEYNGKKWHETEDAIRRDQNKVKLCLDNNITLYTIKENSRNYESDIKMQLIAEITSINKILEIDVIDEDILNIDCSEIYSELLSKRNLDDLECRISECVNISEFQKKFRGIYTFLQRSKKLSLLSGIRKKEELTNSEIVNRCLNIFNYEIFTKDHNKLYQLCIKRNLLDYATKHMVRKNKKYRTFSDKELVRLSINYLNKSDIKNNNKPLYTELKNRKILETVFSLKY